jgi:hypothetical protein
LALVQIRPTIPRRYAERWACATALTAYPLDAGKHRFPASNIQQLCAKRAHRERYGSAASNWSRRVQAAFEKHSNSIQSAPQAVRIEGPIHALAGHNASYKQFRHVLVGQFVLAAFSRRRSTMGSSVHHSN